MDDERKSSGGAFWASIALAFLVGAIVGMSDALGPVMGVAFSAVCVWLTVRIVNRRERWAKWTLAIVIGLPVLYLASFGLVCWMSTPIEFRDRRVVSTPRIYFPIGIAARQSNVVYQAVSWFAYAGRSDGTHPRLRHRRAVDVGAPTCWDGTEGIRL